MLDIKYTMKNICDGLISRLDRIKERKESVSLKITQNWNKKRKKNEKKMEQNTQELWDNYKGYKLL